MWDAATGLRLATFDHRWASAACFRDGKMVASGGFDSTVRLWDLKDRKLEARLGQLGRETKIIGPKYIEHFPWPIGFVDSLAFGTKDEVLISGGGTAIGIRHLQELIFWGLNGAAKITLCSCVGPCRGPTNIYNRDGGYGHFGEERDERSAIPPRRRRNGESLFDNRQ